MATAVFTMSSRELDRMDIVKGKPVRAPRHRERSFTLLAGLSGLAAC